MTPQKLPHTLRWLVALLLLASTLQGAFHQAPSDGTALRSVPLAEPMLSARAGEIFGAEFFLRDRLSRFPDLSQKTVLATAPTLLAFILLSATACLAFVPGPARCPSFNTIATRAPPSFRILNHLS